MKHVFFILIIATFFGCYSKDPEKTGKEGQPMPSFKLLLTDSATYVNTADIKSGKATVFFYYGPQCPYSRTQMEEMLQEINSFKSVQIYVITFWPFAEMKNFYLNYHLKEYPNIVVGFDSVNFFGEYFKIAGFPFTAIYGKDKKLIKAFEGKIYSKQIIKTLDQ